MCLMARNLRELNISIAWLPVKHPLYTSFGGLLTSVPQYHLLRKESFHHILGYSGITFGYFSVIFVVLFINNSMLEFLSSPDLTNGQLLTYLLNDNFIIHKKGSFIYNREKVFLFNYPHSIFPNKNCIEGSENKYFLETQLTETVDEPTKSPIKQKCIETKSNAEFFY